MAQEERYGKRPTEYSAWHRRDSTRRFVGIESAQRLAMIDIDVCLYVEYDDGSKEPLALIETAQDVGQDYKSASVTANLARRAGIVGIVLLYKLSDKRNPAAPGSLDIKSFRYQRVQPPTSQWVECTPKEWAGLLLAIRTWNAKNLDEWFASPNMEPERGNMT